MTHVYQMSDDDLTRNINRAKDVVIDSLRIEGYLTQEQADELHTHYSVIIESRSWMPEFLANWLGLSKDSMSVRMVKAIGRMEKK